MSEAVAPAKKAKVDRGACIICTKESPFNELVCPQDEISWKSLYEVAVIRQFSPIINFAKASTSNPLEELRYHRKCRSLFTHKKALSKIDRQNEANCDNGSTDLTRPNHPRAQSTPESRVYSKVCIFCERQSKYIKRSNRREPLTLAVDLRADNTIREIATKRLDERILSITSRDIVAAEAHYHKTCYRDYTRQKTVCEDSELTDENDEDTYAVIEKAAVNSLFKYIRNELFNTPKIVALHDLTMFVVSIMNSNGEETIRDSTKFHLRRTLQKEFGEALHFFSVNRRIYIRPDNLSVDSIAEDFIQLKIKQDMNTDMNDIHSKIEVVAGVLRDQVKQSSREQPWPPKPEELKKNYTNIPENLTQFLNILLGGTAVPSARTSRISWSIAQDIITAVTLGKTVTEKHILLPWVIKTLTGNVELIRIMNRLGHSISYSSLEKIDTALSIEKLQKVDCEDIPLPGSIHPLVPTVLAFDNIDRQEEVLSGAGTTHRVNGIIVQPASLSCTPQRISNASLKREKRRSIVPFDNLLPIYTVGRRRSPPPITPLDLSKTLQTSTDLAHQQNLLWMMTRMQNSTPQTINSWTGFNILCRDEIDITPDMLGYLPTINAPATEMSTVQEILRQSVAIQISLELQDIAVVLDQALFAKATEVAWREHEHFKNVVLMMGNFHTICNLMSTIGKRFGDAGLRDLAVESGTIAEGSISKVLEGKHYNRAVRLHKLTYESLMRLAWQGFIQWLHKNHTENVHHVDNVMEKVVDLHENINQAFLQSILQTDSWRNVFELFGCFLDVLRFKNGPLSAFWMSYIDLVEILLGLIRADREGNWYLHLACIKDMIPWCFAMNKTNYSRYLPVYFAKMTHLQETAPDLHKHFLNKGFSVQLNSSNPFGRIAVDQATEETVNKDTQTSGGTRGFSLKPGAVSRYYLTAEHRVEALRQLRDQISIETRNLSHPDLGKTRIQTDESDVQSMLDILENNWINPFQAECSELISISSGTAATELISSDLLTAHEKGQEAYKIFQERLTNGEGFYDPIKKLTSKTFSDMKKMTSAGKDKSIVLKADRRLFGNMVLIAQNRKLDMRKVLCHPLGPLPWALSNGDGTMKKTNKSTLASHLENRISFADGTETRGASLLDAMALIQKLHGDNNTFDELSDAVLTQVLHAGHTSGRIDVVFDVYRSDSIKSAERVNRGSKDSIIFTKLKAGHKIKNWRKLLACNESKTNLISFLVESWQTPTKRSRLGDRCLFVTHGSKCMKLTVDEVTMIEELESNHEEADTRLLLHAKHAAQEHTSITCVSDDTDVLILFLCLAPVINTKIYIRRGTKSRVRLVDIKKLVAVLGEDVSEALVGLHAWTGCDSISALSGQGKLKALKLVLQEETFRKTFSDLGKEWQLTQELFSQIQAFTCKLYCKNTKCSDVNEMRYIVFRSSGGNIGSGQLPPCEDTLFQHTLRANYQSAVWRRSLQSSPVVPDPAQGHGWERDCNGNIAITWMKGSPAPEIVLELMSCKCSRICRPTDCTCLLNGMRCTTACRLLNCSNMEDDDSDDERDSNNHEDSQQQLAEKTASSEEDDSD